MDQPVASQAEDSSVGDGARIGLTGLVALEPPFSYSNEEIARGLDLPALPRICRRIGIERRRTFLRFDPETGTVAGKSDETEIDVAAEIGARSLLAAGLSPARIGALAFVSCTAQRGRYSHFGLAAFALVDRLGVPRTAHRLEFNLACDGFVQAVHHARALFRLPRGKAMLLIASSVPSLYLDRAAARRFREARLQEAAFPNYVFGDHAVAAVLSSDRVPGELDVVASWTGCDPANPLSWAVHLPGMEEHGYAIDFEAVATSYVPAIRDAVAGLRGQSPHDPLSADRFYFHQANGALPLAAADALGIPREKLAMSARLRGNTSVASVPALIAEDLAAGRIARGALICAAAVGAGAGFSGFLAKVG